MKKIIFFFKKRNAIKLEILSVGTKIVEFIIEIRSEKLK